MTTDVKYFTPAEAIRTLPLVRSIVADILTEGKEIKLLAEELAEEELNQDPRLLARLEQIDKYLKELEEIGCYYKDWNFTYGLVDFPAMINGEEVYLCWRSDEESIRYYHGVNTGYADRRMIPEEFFTAVTDAPDFPKLVVFDLDGTLTDSSTTIYKSTHRTFRELGMNHTIEKTQLDARIGAHFQEIFDDLHIDVGNVEDFIHIYKGFYFDYLPETSLYEGAEEILHHLKKRNCKTALLTTKAQDQAEKILHSFKLDGYFDLIMGRRPGMAVKPSPEPLQYIMRELLVAPQDTLMVGDSELDIRCGKNAGTHTAAVTYGYRTEELLRKEQPDFLVTRLSELKEIIK